LEDSVLNLDAPTEILRTVPRQRRPNAELCTREHLTPGEVETLIEAAKANRYGHRDATMVLIAFRHGLRAAEVCDLRWDQTDFDGAVIHIRRGPRPLGSASAGRTQPPDGTPCTTRSGERANSGAPPVLVAFGDYDAVRLRQFASEHGGALVERWQLFGEASLLESGE